MPFVKTKSYLPGTRLALGLLKELRLLAMLTTFTAVLPVFLVAKYPLDLTVGLFFLSGFFLLYAVHALDTYEDAFVQNEDQIKAFRFAHGSSGILTKNELIGLATIASIGFFITIAALAVRAGTAFLIPLLAAFLIGITYSRILSKNMFISLAAYPVGIVLAMGSAYLLAGATNWVIFTQLALPTGLLLLGAKVWMDIADADTDRTSGRPNIANTYGVKLSKKVAFALLLGALAVSLIFFFDQLRPLRVVVSIALAAAFIKAYYSDPVQGAKILFPAVYLTLLVQVIWIIR